MHKIMVSSKEGSKTASMIRARMPSEAKKALTRGKKTRLGVVDAARSSDLGTGKGIMEREKPKRLETTQA